MSGIEVAGGRKIILPMSRAVEISLRSLKIRFGRSLITTSGVVLAIAFLMSVWSSNEIVSSLRDVNKSEINLLLQKKGVETGLTDGGAESEDAKARLQEEQEAEAARAMRNIYDQAQTAFVRSQSAPQSVLSAIDDNGE